MNDIARAPLSTTDDAPSATPTALTVQSPPRRVSDLRETADHRGISLTWLRLDRLATAATLGIVLVAPQTALLLARMLGPRIPPSAPADSGSGFSTATRRQGMGR
jgi:hypothetical protein